MDVQTACEQLQKQGVPPETVNAFVDYITDNFDVWRAFERFTLEAIAAHKKLGAKAIMERVRWDAEVEKGGTFKANNNYTAYLARVFEMKHPMYRNYFEYREIRGLKNG